MARVTRDRVTRAFLITAMSKGQRAKNKSWICLTETPRQSREFQRSLAPSHLALRS